MKKLLLLALCLSTILPTAAQARDRRGQHRHGNSVVVGVTAVGLGFLGLFSRPVAPYYGCAPLRRGYYTNDTDYMLNGSGQSYRPVVIRGR